MLTTKRALVLAGGGVAGIAWETGLLTGLQDEDPGLSRSILAAATTFVGTSAGSTVAAQLAGGTPLEELFGRQVSPESAELNVEVDMSELMAMMSGAMSAATSPEEIRRMIGKVAVDAKTVPPVVRRAAIDARLPVKDWTSQPLLIPAVEIETGDLRVFDRASGVGLVDAVAASCAVPAVWPPVDIDGRLYMDGGTRSVSNADLAAGAEFVLILVPGPAASPMGPAIADAELAALAPARIHSVFADEASIQAIGINPLDPGTRPAAARAGRDQGRRIAPQISEFWS